MEQVISFENFILGLQQVLPNLYDPAQLRKSSLISLFGLENRPNPGLAIQDLITNAIQALRPRMDVPLQSNAWRYYNILSFRFVEQSSQAQVADTMGLSVRQLRREERESEILLGEYLWKKYNLDLKLNPVKQTTDQPDEPLFVETLNPSSQENELLWIQEAFPEANLPIQELIASALQLTTPLAQENGQEIICQFSDDLPPVCGHVTAMRQALLNLFLAALHMSACSQVLVKGEIDSGMLRISIKCEGGEWTLQVGELVEMAGKFTAVFRGEQIVQPSPGFQVSLLLPYLEQLPILVIDDNADTLQLLNRYLTGTPFRFIGVRDPEKALAVAQEKNPQVIVMDVMMPGIDDWELLGRLRSHPNTRHIPIVICTILPQERLAMALGATAFLRKPVNRDAFLAVLELHSGHDAHTPC